MFQFYFLLIAVQFSQSHLLKRLSFPSVYSCLLYHRLIDQKCVLLFLGFLTCSVDLYFSHVPLIWTLFIIDKNRKQSICPWVNEWLNSDTSHEILLSDEKEETMDLGKQLVWISEAFHSKYYTLQYLFAAAAAKSLQSCLTLCDPIDGSPPGPTIPGILQARTLEWVAISFSNAWKWKVKVKSLSRVRLFVTPWTVAY